MSRNKKIIILVTILVIIILGIVGVFVYKNREVNNIAIGESNENQIQEDTEQQNAINAENSIENTETNNVEQNNTVEDNEILQNQVAEVNKTQENTQAVPEQNAKTSAKKENSKTTTATTSSKQQATQEKTPSQPQKSESSVKSEETTSPSKNNDSSYKEQEVQVAPKTECVGNNHKIGAGNTGKWFGTKAQADSYYNAEIEKWGNMWENGEIEKAEYLKKCPSGYEVWTCPQCQKWTINFYYR